MRADVGMVPYSVCLPLSNVEANCVHPLGSTDEIAKSNDNNCHREEGQRPDVAISRYRITIYTIYRWFFRIITASWEIATVAIAPSQ